VGRKLQKLKVANKKNGFKKLRRQEIVILPEKWVPV
jgi:hypothetical protein